MESTTFVTRTIVIHTCKALHPKILEKCSRYIEKDIQAAIEKLVREKAGSLYGLGIGAPIISASREKRIIYRCPRAVHGECGRFDIGCSAHGTLIRVEAPESYSVTLCGLVSSSDLFRFRRRFNEFVSGVSLKFNSGSVEVMPYDPLAINLLERLINSRATE